MTTQTPATAKMEIRLRIWVRFFPNFLLLRQILVRKKNAETCWSRLKVIRIRSHFSLLPCRDERTVKFFNPSPVLICKFFENRQSDPVLIRLCKIIDFYFASWAVFLGRFRDPIRVPIIENRVPTFNENHHRVTRIKENRVLIIRKIGSLQVHIGFLTFSLKKRFRRQNNYSSYFSFSQIRLVERKIVPAMLLPHEVK